MDIMDYLNTLDAKEVDAKLKATSSTLTFKKNNDIIISDTSWIDVVEEIIPYLDHIIRNPRSFIVEEEALVPIEKTKVVSEASIKHLAQNTNLIQEVQKDGTIIPVKLLNIYREDTNDLYENRFIKTLVAKLEKFIDDRIEEGFINSYAKVVNSIKYSGLIKTMYEEVNIDIMMNSKFNKEKKQDLKSLEERIMSLKSIIGEFKESVFMRNIQNAEYVHSPLRRTNVLLKEPNFNKCLELWEYLEGNQDKKFKLVDKKVETIEDENIRKAFDLTSCIDSAVCGGKEKLIFNNNVDSSLTKVINDYVLNNDTSETEFKKTIIKEFNEAKKRKAKRVEHINELFTTMLDDYEKTKRKVNSILK